MKIPPACARFSLRAATLVALMCASIATSFAEPMDIDSLTKNVWERLYNVPNADDPAWLAKDDDGDGNANGEEIAAGTDPASAGSTIQVTSTTLTGNVVHLSFKTLKGKKYTVQKTTDLQNPASWADVVPLAEIMGTNGTVTLDAPYAVNTFYRVLVRDIDTDGDGVGDWAEMKLGLDPNSGQSNGDADSYGRPVTDSEYASDNFNAENEVTVSALGSDSIAAQPDPGQEASDLGAFTITRAGLPTVLKTVTLNLTIGGNAVAGTDYTAIASTLVMPAGVRTLTVPVHPLANANRKAPVAATLTIAAGTGYTVGGAKTAAVTIEPTGTATGTGLTGAYYNNAATPYASPTNFAAANLVATRTDATVDFRWSTTTPASAALPPGITPSSYCIRWTGQIQPQYSETYFFDVYARQGCVLKIGGQTVINNWTNLGALTHMIGSIALQAGIRYDIQLDYFSNSGTAVSETHLNWYSSSQASQVVPMNRLYPAVTGVTAAPPTITSAPEAFAFLNQPFTFDITTSSGDPATAVSISAGTLPAGLSFAQVVSNGVVIGRISGTPTVAGDFQLVATAANTAGSSSAALDLQVLDSGNGITKEVWTGLTGPLTVASIPVNTAPNISTTVNTFEDTATNYGDNYGVRIRGYMNVQTSGMYYFWLAGNDAAELWISNDTEPVNKVKRAATTGAGSTARQWSAHASQKSGWMEMTAGVKYYVEVLHRGGSGSANTLAVGAKNDTTGNGTALANGAGVVPGYLLWKYFTPPVAFASDAGAQGNLYFTKMGPQGGANTSGTGLATIRLNAAETQAIVKFNYSGLTTAVTGKHIHNDQYLNHPSQIIFDMDTAIPQSDGSYVWDITSVGTFTGASEQVQLIREGKAYINIHTVNYPNGEIRGNFTIANGAQNFVPPVHPNPSFTLPAAPTDAEAARFLTQATFGPHPDDIAAVKTSGFPSWLNTQFNLAPSHLMDLTFDTKDVNNRYPDEETYNAFWRVAVTGPDQLRQRVAYALSQIMVTSAIGPLDNNARALSSYYDVLADNAFGNFRTLLKAVTLHPAMGRYLDMLGNRNGDLVTGRIPNENYAREILQLFSIGLNRLWPDGSLVLDSKFSLVPTYDQSSVLGYSRVFTGWNYNQPRAGSGRLPTNFGGYNDNTGWMQPMQLFPANGTASTSSVYHELGSKKLLNNVYLPPATVTNPANTILDTDPTSPYYNENLFDANGLRDLDKALDAIFEHPNTGPFICRQLIQRLVTSAPTPGYVYRVVQAFSGERTWDGQVTGVRGDMKEVIKAILLDYEARSSALLTSSTFGKQREPVLRVTAPSRYFLSKPVSGTFTQSSTYNAATNPFPNRMRLDLTGDLLVGAGEWVALKFDTLTSGSPLPPTTYNTNTWYWTRTAPTFTQAGAVSPRTNPSIFVDAFGAQGATYRLAGPIVTATVDINADTFTSTAHGLVNGDTIWINATTTPGGISLTTQYFVRDSAANTFKVSTTSGGAAVNITSIGAGVSFQKTSGTVLTINSVASAPNNTLHSLIAGASCYLRFFGTGAPADGIYTVVTAPTTTQFTVTAAAAGALNGLPACFNRQAGCSYTPNNDHSIINMWSPVAHRLAVGQEVYITDNPGTALPISGRRTVVTIPNGPDGQPDPYRFTVNASGTGNSTLSIGGVTIFPLIAPALDRTGTVSFFNSTWFMNRTDADSTTASLSQTPMGAQTVFNFYFPDYAYPGDLALNGITTPEFQLTSDTSIMLLTNFLEQGIQQSGLNDGRTSFRSGNGAIVLDMYPYMSATYAANGAPGSNSGIDKFVKLMNDQLMGGTMSTGMRDGIVNYVSSTANFPYTYTSGTPNSTHLTQFRNRLRAVVQLVITSTEFAIQR